MAKKKSTTLVWLDLEMTGLDPEKHTILEAGLVVTNGQCEVVEEGPHLIIHHSDRILNSMEEWSRHCHEATGLTEQSRQSKVVLKEAEKRMLDFVKKYCVEKTAPLCGNSIGHDRRFLCKYMPRFESYLSFRNIDVSSIKELVMRWYPSEYHCPPKKKKHRSMDDIYESIEELKFYREKVFVPLRKEH